MRIGVLLVVLLLAGCTEEPAPDIENDPGPDDVAPEGPASEGPGFEAPTWQVGDWWRYRFDDGTERTWVVTEAGTGYTVDIDDPEFAFVDAALSDVSTIGPVTSELDGLQDGASVRFFDWPLTATKTWDLTWDGIAFAATASVSASGAAIEAVGADGSLRQYTYDNASGWFGSMLSVDTNGSLEWRIELVDSGSDYPGTYARYALHDPKFQVIDGTARNTVGALEVPAGATDVWTDVSFACDAGQAGGVLTYELVPPEPNQEGLMANQRCPANPFQETRVIPAHVGGWRDALTATGVTGHIWVVPRTLTESSL